MKNLSLIFIASWLLNGAVFISLAQAQEVAAPSAILECWCKCKTLKTYRGNSCEKKDDCYSPCAKACGSRGLADYDCVTQKPIITREVEPTGTETPVTTPVEEPETTGTKAPATTPTPTF